jgi:hypothetical protein
MECGSAQPPARRSKPGCKPDATTDYRCPTSARDRGSGSGQERDRVIATRHGFRTFRAMSDDVVPVDRQLGSLERIDPRSVWKHEAHDFTPWLADNADRLAEALGIDIEITGTEHPGGGFSLDMIGRDVTHVKPFIIENQLAGSDHGHLGQLLTYAAGTGAATIVWIATAIRDEHRQALTWLNDQTGPDTHFFGVELDLERIGNSLPAPLFNVVVLPNDWQKSVRAATAANAEGTAALYWRFWDTYVNRVHRERPTLSKAKGGWGNNWFPMSVGLPVGCRITAVFVSGGQLRSELYIERDTPEECKALFDELHDQKGAFEAAYGSPLSWERLDNRKACRIAEHQDGSSETPDDYDDYINWIIAAGDQMRRTLARHVA